MKLTSSLFALLLIAATSSVYAEDVDVEIDFISGSEYAEMYTELAASKTKFIDDIAKSDYANDELEMDFISGSEYVAMDEENNKKGWFAFLGLD